MTHDRDTIHPHVEPEIIPPGAAPRGNARPAGTGPRIRVFVAGSGPAGRGQFRMPGPFTIAAVVLGAGLLLGLLLFLVLGALLIALPVLVVAFSAALATVVVRGWFRRRARGRSVAPRR